MLTILVVDDEPATVSLLRELLEECGYRVLSAHNGKEALSHLAEGNPIDVIVTDYKMPVLDGGAMSYLIENDPRYAAHRSTPIVLMSATANMDGDSYSKFAAFVRKPFTLDTIPDVVARLVGSPGYNGGK